jgi:hypothetical protein
MSIKCFLCGNEQADPLPYSETGHIQYWDIQNL